MLLRSGDDIQGRSAFNDRPGLHDQDSLADFLYKSNVVTDEQQAHFSFSLQLKQQLNDLCLLSAMSALVLPPANVWGWRGQAAAAKAPWHVCLWD